MNYIREGDSVLIIWNNHDEESLSKLVEEIKYKTKNGIIILENSEVITEHSRPHSAFDVIVSNWIFPYHVKHTDSLLGLYLKLLKPTGRLILKDEFDITTSLKINGFVKVFVCLNDIIIAQKPDFEIGSKCSLQLSDRKPSTWKLDSTLEEAWSRDGDDETIDDNQLLDENDMIKPDKQSLRVCATTGKRKACADCVCGLAEELRGQTKETPKSSCGSCYLGDAFRCASCPYLGMPAFKPGDKVVLDLKSDI